MSDKNQNLQDLFLNALRRSKTPVTMFLVKGVKLQGIITWFDNFSLLLRRDGQSQLVYKHAISTIMPSHDFDLASLGASSPSISSACCSNANARCSLSTSTPFRRFSPTARSI